ncbi:cell division protein FtsQ/DivIB [Parvibium lacunae]|uniref:Cell division protein FtsQ n=1 Tax=Parvibium lacunae TaxID=1888893 RepID=A0A368L227_9BURK|nr:cell division protein FtsQ/DivIB [Parvibium lacunae]RCS57553.1 cell division protein FtsQ [Parvibium lacunae]
MMNLWHDPLALRRLSLLLGIGLVLLWLAYAIRWVMYLPYFELQHIQVSAKSGMTLQYVTVPTLRAGGLGAGWAQAGPTRHPNQSFFGVNLDAVKQSFETVPWVRKASVRRLWPNGLLVEIEEHRALAQWGESRLLNQQGEIFTANLDEAELDGPLPELSGPDSAAALVAQRFALLQSQLSKLPLGPQAIQQLTLTPRYAWQIRLNNGMQLALGRDRTDVDLTAQVSRFVAVYPQLQKQLGKEIDYVDLRYSNGFAVRANAVKLAAAG